MFKISRIWNCLIYFIIHFAKKMIWDYTGKNKNLLTNDEFLTEYSETIMCWRGWD